MRLTLLALALPLLVSLSPARGRGADWRPAKGPLMTKWAGDVSPDKVHPKYPRPQMVRQEWQSLNGLWEFALAKKDEAAPLGKKLDGQILVPFPVESALSGVMKAATPGGDGLRVWYRRTFDVKKEWAEKRLLLHFGAVNWEATVWVNGKKLDTHRGGYDGFRFDITDALKKDGPQEIVVGVWNPIDSGSQPRGKQVRRPGGIFYTASTGIWQTVWLEPVPKAHIESLTIAPDVDGSKVRVTVRGRGTGEKDRVEISLTGRHLGFVTPTKPGPNAPPPGPGVERVADARGALGQAIELPIRPENVKLWSPESPFLYGVQVDLYRDGEKAADSISSYCALRKIAVGKDEKGVTRMLLNGKPYLQVGPLDQGFWPDGLYTAPTDEALRYEVEMTKKLGFNMIRKHVKVEPERWYYWCDKLGVLVWQDMPSGDKSVARGKGQIERSPESAKQYELELTRLIEGRGNHPCIVMWVPFNEGWGQFDTERVVGLVKKLDPSRLVDPASGWNDYPCGDVHDIHVYPGPGSPEPQEKRAAVLGEFGGLGLKVDGHTWENKTWGYQGTRDSADLTAKYERLLRHVYELKEKPGLSAAVYTQTTDVETEGNGLMTYDRAVVKVDAGRVAAANRGDFSKVPQPQEPAARPAGRPNIVVLMTDDQRFDAMSCAGNTVLKTPNMDRIAREGMRFRNMFVTNSLCAPSRATLMTGLYSHSHGVRDNTAKRPDVPLSIPFVSDHLRAAGYEVAFCGKSHARSAFRDRKWDYYFGYKGQGDYLKPRIAEGTDGPDKLYTGWMDDVVTDHAVAWLKKERHKPFCLFLFFKAPHRSWDPPPRHKDLFAGVTIPKPDLWDADRSAKPSAFAKADNRIGSFKDVPDLDHFLKNYYRCLTGVDDNVGKVFGALTELGRLDDTFMMYTSDNGFFAGEWRAFDKRFMHEPSIRVPMLIRYPKVAKAGSVCDRMVLNVDIAPTLLDVAGLAAPKEMQGRSMLPLLKDPTAEWRKDWLYEYYEYPGPHSVRKHRGVRTERYKYIHYYEEPQEFELYDLQKDPEERTNLYGQRGYEEITAALRKRLQELRKETGDSDK